MKIYNSKEPSVISENIISSFASILDGFNAEFELVKRASFIHACKMQIIEGGSLFGSRSNHEKWEAVKSLIRNYKKE